MPEVVKKFKDYISSRDVLKDFAIKLIEVLPYPDQFKSLRMLKNANGISVLTKEGLVIIISDFKKTQIEFVVQKDLPTLFADPAQVQKNGITIYTYINKTEKTDEQILNDIKYHFSELVKDELDFFLKQAAAIGKKFFDKNIEIVAVPESLKRINFISNPIYWFNIFLPDDQDKPSYQIDFNPFDYPGIVVRHNNSGQSFKMVVPFKYNVDSTSKNNYVKYLESPSFAQSFKKKLDLIQSKLNVTVGQKDIEKKKTNPDLASQLFNLKSKSLKVRLNFESILTLLKNNELNVEEAKVKIIPIIGKLSLEQIKRLLDLKILTVKDLIDFVHSLNYLTLIQLVRSGILSKSDSKIRKAIGDRGGYDPSFDMSFEKFVNSIIDGSIGKLKTIDGEEV